MDYPKSERATNVFLTFSNRLGSALNSGSFRDVVDVITHGNEQVEESGDVQSALEPIGLDIENLQCTSTHLHFRLHCAAPLENLATPDNQRKEMSTKARV